MSFLSPFQSLSLSPSVYLSHAFKYRPVVWLVSANQMDLRLTQTLYDWPSKHIVGSAAGCLITSMIAVVSFSRRNWPGLLVMAELGLSGSPGRLAVLASLSHSRSDSVWQGSSILINLIISSGKGALCLCWRLPYVTTPPHGTRHPSRSPVTLKAIFLVTAILRAYSWGWLLYWYCTFKVLPRLCFLIMLCVFVALIIWFGQTGFQFWVWIDPLRLILSVQIRIYSAERGPVWFLDLSQAQMPL